MTRSPIETHASIHPCIHTFMHTYIHTCTCICALYRTYERTVRVSYVPLGIGRIRFVKPYVQYKIMPVPVGKALAILVCDIYIYICVHARLTLARAHIII